MYSSSGYMSPPVGGFTSPQNISMSQMMPGAGSPAVSSIGYGHGMLPTTGGGSPVFQSPSANKFPAHGGPVIFTPHSNASPGSGMGIPSTAPVSPYQYTAGTPTRPTSFIQSPPAAYGGVAHVYSPPPYSSTMVSNPVHPTHPTSPVVHGYGPPTQYANVQPYGYGARAMAGSYVYMNPYQHHQAVSPYYGPQHSPRDEIVEPMHCSPVNQGQLQHAIGSPMYPNQQYHRSPSNPPSRPQYMPAYFTGVDHVVAAVPPRPRRVFDRSPSTSPPVAGAGSRSPQPKSPTWLQQDGGQQSAGFSSGQIEGTSPTTGTFAKRAQGQGPNRQLKFTETQYFQDLQAAEEKEKAKRTGPPVRGFGVSEEITNFINSPLLKENSIIVPGAAIAQEAIARAGVNVAVAESNWITVFGFPAAAASFILTHFSQYGSVIQSRSNPGGNWLHVQYASRIDARRALACNGKVLGGTIMVGVISSPKEVIETYEKPRDSPSAIPESSGSRPGRAKSPLQERNVDSLEQTKPRIRPLATTSQITGTFTSPILSGDKSSSSATGSIKDTGVQSPQTDQNENVPLPAPSTGILTKAMEYMFGW